MENLVIMTIRFFSVSLFVIFLVAAYVCFCTGYNYFTSEGRGSKYKKADTFWYNTAQEM